MEDLSFWFFFLYFFACFSYFRVFGLCTTPALFWVLDVSFLRGQQGITNERAPLSEIQIFGKIAMGAHFFRGERTWAM